ncbi:hypothetical protein B0T24DRAFT_338929 [Lasiosphaeria ovina]|uniref:Uncharacterized protein n=1 Tax=Lasiosphaeria ovina TaxID=92902 RepID=A0AAE0N697_9PEZI|nr:hypothetical protein B0T24DRAFT_338929 [Lasiosphaeria ovina]
MVSLSCIDTHLRLALGNGVPQSVWLAALSKPSQVRARVTTIPGLARREAFASPGQASSPSGLTAHLISARSSQTSQVKREDERDGNRAPTTPDAPRSTRKKHWSPSHPPSLPPPQPKGAPCGQRATLTRRESFQIVQAGQPLQISVAPCPPVLAPPRLPTTTLSPVSQSQAAVGSISSRLLNQFPIPVPHAAMPAHQGPSTPAPPLPSQSGSEWPAHWQKFNSRGRCSLELDLGRTWSGHGERLRELLVALWCCAPHRRTQDQVNEVTLGT